VSFWDRVGEVIPHTGRAWIEAIVIAAILGVLIFVVVPRLVKSRWLRLAIAGGLLLIAGWLTVLPAFFDKKVDEQLLGFSSAAPATVDPPTTIPSASPTSTVPAGPAKVSTGSLRGLAGHYGRGEASVYRLPDGSHFVRLENIDTPRAPAVYVYLVPSSNQTGPAGGVNLGALRGNQGRQNYVIPREVDVSQYKTVLLWCDRFSTSIANATQTPV
jgi:hypothetical protein